MARIELIAETTSAAARDRLRPVQAASLDAPDAAAGGDAQSDEDRFRDPKFQDAVVGQHKEPGMTFVLRFIDTGLEKDLVVPKYLTNGKLSRGLLDDVDRINIAIGVEASKGKSVGHVLTNGDVMLALSTENLLNVARDFIAKFCGVPASEVREGLSLPDTRTALNAILAQIAAELESRKKGPAPVATAPPSAGASSSRPSSAPTRSGRKNTSKRR